MRLGHFPYQSRQSPCRNHFPKEIMSLGLSFNAPLTPPASVRGSRAMYIAFPFSKNDKQEEEITLLQTVSSLAGCWLVIDRLLPASLCHEPTLVGPGRAEIKLQKFPYWLAFRPPSHHGRSLPLRPMFILTRDPAEFRDKPPRSTYRGLCRSREFRPFSSTAKAV